MSDTIKNYVDHIEGGIVTALMNAEQLKKHVLEVEGDSDLHRKVAFYLEGGLQHWLTGAQAGNIKDLRELLARRLAQQEIKMEQSHAGDGHEVLTKPAP